MADETTTAASTGTTDAAAETKAAETTAAETTTTTETTAETKASTDTQTQNAGAPEKYALTLPDDAGFDAAALTGFEADARLDGLTNKQAQARLDRTLSAEASRREALTAELKADPTYGGDKLAVTQKHASAVLDKFAPVGTPHGDRFRALLRVAGDDVSIAAVLTTIGKAMAEDRLPDAARGVVQVPAKKVSASEAFYGDNPLGLPRADALTTN